MRQVGPVMPVISMAMVPGDSEGPGTEVGSKYPQVEPYPDGDTGRKG